MAGVPPVTFSPTFDTPKTQEKEMINRISNIAKVLVVAQFVLIASTATAGGYGDMKSKYKAKADIVDTAVAAGQFSTLAAALQAADLVDTLKGDGPFTVFAPTDEAFAKLPEGTVEELLKPENRDQLVSVLTYHVVPGKVAAADVVKITEATTVQGSDISIAVVDGNVKIDDATVVKADIGASNGIIHVIDNVILPN